MATKRKFNLKDVVRQLWQNRRALYWWCGIAIVLGVIFALTNPKEYTVTTAIVPEQSSSTGLASIASMMGLPQDKAIRELLWMGKKGYLTNMTLGRTAVRVDLTVDPNEFKVLICKTCGSQVRVRRGGGGRCDHCGTFMKDEGAADV